MEQRPQIVLVILIVIVIVIVIGLSPIGCTRPVPTEEHVSAAARVPRPTVRPAESLPLSVGRERLAEMIVESQHKRVWGRYTAYDEVQRIVHQLGPFTRE